MGNSFENALENTPFSVKEITDDVYAFDDPYDYAEAMVKSRLYDDYDKAYWHWIHVIGDERFAEILNNRELG